MIVKAECGCISIDERKIGFCDDHALTSFHRGD